MDIIELVDEVFLLDEPPVGPVFALLFPSKYISQFIPVLNKTSPLDSIIKNPERVFYPSIGASPHRNSSGQYGVYVPKWKREFSLSHLKRCKTHKNINDGLILIGESPVISSDVVKMLENVNKTALSVKSSEIVTCKSNISDFKANIERSTAAAHKILESWEGKYCLDRHCITGDEHLDSILNSLGVQATWRYSLSSVIHLVQIWVPVIPASLQRQQQAWNRTWPCFFNRKRSIQKDLNEAQGGISLSASERSSPLTPTGQTDQEKSIHLKILKDVFERHTSQTQLKIATNTPII